MINKKFSFLYKLQFWVISITVIAIVFVSSVNYLTYASGQEAVQEQSEKNQTNNETLEIKAETFEGKSDVKIKQQFSLSTTSRETIIDEIIKRTALNRNETDAALELVPSDEKNNAKEKFEVNINTNDCISKVTINREFILDTTDRKNILDKIMQLTQPTKKEIEKILEFEIDEIKIMVNVEKGKAKVQISYCDQNIRFILNTSDENSIINAISEKQACVNIKFRKYGSFKQM